MTEKQELTKQMNKQNKIKLYRTLQIITFFIAWILLSFIFIKYGEVSGAGELVALALVLAVAGALALAGVVAVAGVVAAPGVVVGALTLAVAAGLAVAATAAVVYFLEIIIIALLQSKIEELR
jgi:hypothetical protein